ncbi:hypothetical protein EGH21_04110 [Halomicroarcula sp. F13]|uniref:Uncharacterized protein n=1 Tax=Haloarcula rubra TaxID=2487747 RepID=A0AAW4PPR0_9EURY|nr:hypothetical protein [Halomicroarcula rubra]MBX0322214.1 hypothetical protein [Halomicroarcula rubra]
MAHEDNEWRPKGATDTFKGYEVWDHGVWPIDTNHGEVDGDVSLTDEE